ncbi:unnamed protein product [Bursaphelenchus xylophilus]|uniref:(pine wood nematode) hypothetical protein n=1 Tax=Bursaphelenchus xylophilus TaxID=6326 RepID=A0A1I7RW88_BURXY|nr:unnamed protein product [Bursaphelenchus xylophilus]CAG9095282.1 unnamed protein product [Bursaphelenchus xylophilus]
MMKFEGKVVIVTGSNSGIGKQTAFELLRKGAKVTIHGQNEQKISDAISDFKANGICEDSIHYVIGPVQDPQTQKRLIAETVEKFGKLDVLINNAGISHDKSLGEHSAEQFHKVMGINVESVLSLSRQALPHLEKTHGNIVNISSVSGQRAALFWQFYRISKAALDHATKIMAYDFARSGVRVNAVSPGVIKTNFIARNTTLEESDAQFKNYESYVPMNRLGTLQEISNVILFMASELASFMTGAIVVVDGGMLLGPAIKKD